MDFPFVGPTYVARSPNIDCERSINYYPEMTESKGGKVVSALIGCPGKLLFGSTLLAPFRGSYVVRGTPDRCFAVAYNVLYEVNSDGSTTSRGTLRTTAGYVSMTNNPSQLGLVDGSNGYILDLKSGLFTLINAPGFIGGGQLLYLDSYMISNQPETNNWGISGINDGTAWDGLDHAQKEGSPDNITAIADTHRELVLFGQKNSEMWYDSGANNFPFAPIQGVYLETGCAAPFSVAKMDNTIYWIGEDENGTLVVYRLNGYLPQRVSTHSIELFLKQFGDPQQIIAYTYQDEGHAFLIINSPTANTTLCFDSSTELWHERQSFNEAGIRTRDRGNFHSFVFGKHLVFDYSNGNIYNLDLNTYTDNGNTFPRIRIAPHYHKDLKYIFYNSLQIDMETGVGLDGFGQGSSPVAVMKYSNDGGRTWSVERRVSIGKIGEYKARARWTKLGRARDRVFWVEVDDPVKADLLAANLDVVEGRT